MTTSLKKFMATLLIVLPLNACNVDKDLEAQNQTLKSENEKLTTELNDLKVKVARLEERAKIASATSGAVAQPKKSVATAGLPSPAEKAALSETVTGGGSFK